MKEPGPIDRVRRTEGESGQCRQGNEKRDAGFRQIKKRCQFFPQMWGILRFGLRSLYYAITSLGDNIHLCLSDKEEIFIKEDLLVKRLRYQTVQEISK